MKFSDSTNRDGIIEKIEMVTGGQSATSGSYPLKVKTVDVNCALDDYFRLAIKAGGKFQVDDTNQTDYPVITTDIVSGQGDYPFIYDGSTPHNEILDLRQVRLKDSAGIWHDLSAIDRESDGITKYEGINGLPTGYDVDSNSIRLYPIPNYNLTGGLELYISRSPVHFVSTDTTKQAGIPNMFQDYLWLKPSYMYCLFKNLPQAGGLKAEVDKMESAIMEYYSMRDRVDRHRFTTNQTGSNSNK